MYTGSKIIQRLRWIQLTEFSENQYKASIFYIRFTAGGFVVQIFWNFKLVSWLEHQNVNCSWLLEKELDVFDSKLLSYNIYFTVARIPVLYFSFSLKHHPPFEGVLGKRKYISTQFLYRSMQDRFLPLIKKIVSFIWFYKQLNFI